MTPGESIDQARFGAQFAPLFEELRQSPLFSEVKPLLAHYTSIPVLAAVLRNNEIWLSNPLYMNDLEEVRFGITEGVNAFLSSTSIDEAYQTS